MLPWTAPVQTILALLAVRQDKRQAEKEEASFSRRRNREFLRRNLERRLVDYDLRFRYCHEFKGSWEDDKLQRDGDGA
jgi:hypothetical protein